MSAFKKLKILIIFFVLLIINSAIDVSAEEEKILSFDSEVKILSNSTLIVEETIKVYANGTQIKRGIYRDFPTNYKDLRGNFYNVKFEVLSVHKNGTSEAYHTQKYKNGVRLYIGSSNVFISPGVYTYKITYRTNRQVGFYEKYDELYWNVTGNGWAFPILNASAKVIFPKEVNQSSIELDAYTGYSRSKDKAFEKSFDFYGYPYFKTTKELKAYQGFSIVVKFPKGTIKEPTKIEKVLWFVKDNPGGVFNCLALLFVLLYYYVVWEMVGKDPLPGTIIPLYQAPKDFSPQAMRYISRMGFDDRVFVAALVNMATKGAISISEKFKKFSLTRLENDKELSSNEKKVLDILIPAVGNTLSIEQSNHPKFSKAKSALESSLKQEFERKYFVTNLPYFISGFICSILAIVFGGFLESVQVGAKTIFFTVWLSLWSVAVFTLWNVALPELGRYLKVGNDILKVISTVIVASAFTFIEIMSVYAFSKEISSIFLASIIITVFVNLLFYKLLKAPTLLGRRVLDKFEGFKMYLGVAEGDDIRRVRMPKQDLSEYEKYLPYAMAFDLENQWAEKFKNAFASIDNVTKTANPSWYHSSSLDNLSSFSTSNFSSSFNSAISSSSVAPGSGGSGSMGGGGSGGGGGGGGGGGW